MRNMSYLFTLDILVRFWFTLTATSTRKGCPYCQFIRHSRHLLKKPERMILKETQNDRRRVKARWVLSGQLIISIRLRARPIVSNNRVEDQRHQPSSESFAVAIYYRVARQRRGHVVVTKSVSQRPLLDEMWNRWEAFVLAFTAEVWNGGVVPAVESEERDIVPAGRTWDGHSRWRAGQRVDVVST